MQNVKSQIIRSKPIAILLCLIAFHFVNNYIVIYKSHYVFNPDAFTYFEATTEIFRHITKPDLTLEWLNKLHMLLFHRWKPPLFYLTGAFTLFAGIDMRIATLLNNLIYLVILIFATYRTGERLHGQNAGMLAAFLLPFMPAVFAMSRIYMIELALTAMVALTFYMFLLNNFDNFKFAFVCGLVIGLGAFTKQEYMIFILPIITRSIINNFKNNKFADPRFSLNYFISCFLAAILAYQWYIIGDERLNILTYYHKAFLVHWQNMPFYYVETIFYQQALPIFTVLFFISFIFCIYKKKYYLPLSIVYVAAILSWFNVKEARLLLPAYVFLVLMLIDFLYHIKKYRRLLIPGLILCHTFGYFVISYNKMVPPVLKYPFFFEKYHMRPSENGLFGIVNLGDRFLLFKEIVNVIKSNTSGYQYSRPAKMLIISDWYLNRVPISYLITINDLPLIGCHPSSDEQFFHNPKLKNKCTCNFVKNHDFVIIFKDPINIKSINAQYLMKALDNCSEYYVLLYKKKLSAKESVYLYKREYR